MIMKIARLAAVLAIMAGPSAAQTSLNPNPPAATRTAPDLTPPQAGQRTPNLKPVQPGSKQLAPAPIAPRSGTDPILDPNQAGGEESMINKGPGAAGDIVECRLSGGGMIRLTRIECARVGGAS